MELAASFRDPAGFLFRKDGVLYRQVNEKYREDYNLLMNSGLYTHLTGNGLLVSHEEADPSLGFSDVFKVLKPEIISFVSYPYEWSFSQLRDAALLTLDLQLISMEFGMTLKDASAFNIQFQQGRPVMIDTLSFEKYTQGQAWTAYRQFCQHFLAPLALMARKDVRLNSLLLAYIDGVPLDLASSLLPRRTWLQPGLAMHIHIHSKTQKAYSKTENLQAGKSRKARSVSKSGLTGIVQGLRRTVKKTEGKFKGSEWGDYYDSTNYSQTAFASKKNLVKQYLENIRPAMVWDLGANTGVFSRIASKMGMQTVSFDIDPVAVDFNYRQVRANQEKKLLPLLLDLTNPSPGLGWENSEREALFQRGPVDCIMALALVHHLAISNNVPLDRLAAFFHRQCESLIIEFVPKEDSQVKRLLATREDIFDNYSQENFQRVFAGFFHIKQTDRVNDSQRVMYLMQKK